MNPGSQAQQPSLIERKQVETGDSEKQGTCSHSSGSKQEEKIKAMQEASPDSAPTKPSEKQAAPECSCLSDPFASLPVELQPKAQPKKGRLRSAHCPRCGLSYRTNRETDLCIQCEKQAG